MCVSDKMNELPRVTISYHKLPTKLNRTALTLISMGGGIMAPLQFFFNISGTT